jgi:hypothetical protein
MIMAIQRINIQEDSFSILNNNIPSKNRDYSDQSSDSYSYLGRMVNWLNHDESGKSVQMVGWGIAAASLGLIGVSLTVKAIGLAFFSLIAITSVVGIPVGLLGVVVTMIRGGFAYISFKGSMICYEKYRQLFESIYPNILPKLRLSE